MHALTICALWTLWWCSFAGLAAAPEVRTFSRLVLQLGLQCVMVGSFVGAITVYVEPRTMPVWAHLFVMGSAVVGAWLYDYRFGIRRQAGLVRAAACCFAGRVRAFGSACSRRHP